jgi:hypothetical protein
MGDALCKENGTEPTITMRRRLGRRIDARWDVIMGAVPVKHGKLNLKIPAPPTRSRA